MNQTRDPLADQPLGQKLVKKSFWLYFFTAIILPTGYLVRVMISQSLSVQEVGLLYTIIGFVGMLSSYNDLGLTGALIYFIPKLWIEKRKSEIVGLISLASLVQVITTIGISCFLWFGGEWLATHYFHNADAAILLRRFVWYFVGINIFQVVTTVFKSLQDVIRDKVVEAVKMWATVIFCVWVLWGSGMPSLVGFGTARVAGMLTATGVGLILFGTRYGREFMMRPTRARTLSSDFGHYALYTFLAMNAGVLLGQVDQQMVNYFLGNEMAGYYTNFLSLTMLATLVLSPLSGLIYPLFTELFAKNDTDGVRRLIEFYYHELLLLLVSASAFLFVFGPQIATLLFGEEWRFSGELLRRYMPFLWINFMTGIHFVILSAQGKAPTSARIAWIGLIVNVVVNYVGMQMWGVYGAIGGLVASSVVMWVISSKKLEPGLLTFLNLNQLFWITNATTLIALIVFSGLVMRFIDTNLPLLVFYLLFRTIVLSMKNIKGLSKLRSILY